MEFLLGLHSVLRYIIILLAIWVLIKSAKGTFGSGTFTEADNKTSLFLFISCHIMLLIGLIQYFVGANGYQLFETNGVATVMKDKNLRYFAVEHIFANIIGIILISIGRIASKKAMVDKVKFSKLFWFTLIGFVLILSRIPWPFMAAGIGRGWL